MNQKSIQFKTAEERQRDEEFCKHYREIAIPAIIGATALTKEKRTSKSEKEAPKK
jgi:hypothetical protein